MLTGPRPGGVILTIRVVITLAQKYDFIKQKTHTAIFLKEMLREPCVVGSNPAPLTNEWVAQLVEQRIKASCIFAEC